MRLTTRKSLSSKEKERSLLEGGYPDGPRYMKRFQNRRKEETPWTSPRLRRMSLRPPQARRAASQPLSQGSPTATEETNQSVVLEEQLPVEQQCSLPEERSPDASRHMTRRSQKHWKAPPPSQPPSQDPAMAKPKKRIQSDVLADSVPEGKKSTREYSKFVTASGFCHASVQEMEYYDKKIKENGGYDYVTMPGHGRIMSTRFHIPLLKNEIEMYPLDRACKTAIRNYNGKEKTKFRFEKIIKVLTDFWRFYATFKVRGPKKELVTLQARFFRRIGSHVPFRVEVVRLKPKPT